MPLPKPTADQMEQNLLQLAEAQSQGKETFDQALDLLYPEAPAQPPESEDKPLFWRQGEPMPDWMREALLTPPSTPGPDKP